MGDRVGLRRWLLRIALVVVAAVAVGWAGDVRVGSGSDASGKLATARVMADAWTCDPDVGWWAADVDPDATLHQLVNTERHGDQYVQATSVSYQCAVMPLQRAFGPWGPLLLSILGAVAAALAAARMAWRLGGGATAEATAFWLVGLAGPAFFYALDVWEHAPALGLLAWAVALALGPPTVRRALAIGVLGALAVTLRAEAAVFLAALALSGATVPEVRRRWLAAPASCVAGVASAGTVTAGYLLLERVLVSGSVRGARSGDIAGQAGGDLGERFTTAVVTSFGVFASDAGAVLFLGALLCGALLVHGRRAAADPVATPDAVQVALGASILARPLAGLGFIPGVLPAAPMAAVGVFTGRRSPEHRWLVRAALLSPPAIFLLQWSGNLVAQWGGRYLLVSGLVLTAAGCTVIPTDARRPPAGVAVVLAVGLVLGGFGAVWRVDRSNHVAALVDRIQEVPGDAVILTTNVNLGREAGGTYGEHRWLVAGSIEELELAGEVIAEVRPETVVVVTSVDVPELAAAVDGYRLTDTEVLDLFGSPIERREYRSERTFP